MVFWEVAFFSNENGAPLQLFGGWPAEMSYNTNGAAISNAMLETKYFKRATSRLDFVKFRSKRVNRPTSETQPQQKHGNRKPKLVLLEGG